MLRVRNRLFLASDLLLLPGVAYLAFLVRFETLSWTPAVAATAHRYMAVSLVVKLVTLYAFGIYRRLWRHASVSDLALILQACGCSALVLYIAGALLMPSFGFTPQRVPLSVLALDAGFTVFAVGLPRFFARLRATRPGNTRGFRGALIVGAGAAGGLIVRELLANNQLGMTPVGFLDDDVAKHGLRLHNVPVLGGIAELPAIAEQMGVREVIVAIPSASGKTLREIVRRASESGMVARTVPGVYEILSGEKSVSALRRIEIQDLLRRDPITTDADLVASLVESHTVLITGAGGSIGSELGRQLARLRPARIVAVGRGENSIFEIWQELRNDHPEIVIEPVIADIRDERRMQKVFSHYRPHSVFHAAAHKHVPLMEANVTEAILNNVLGTRNVVHCAALCEAEHFVLVSTDKAVRPTSIMGATKRIAESIVHDAAADHGGYVAVRFGNVLGSRGSVVPTFMRQIARGGPIVITHPEMTRYFMTIPEAVQLVLQAAAMGESGEVFVLDMGEPVRVLDLASDMIRLSGLEVGTDIEIVFSGARPGEKLYEELFIDEAHMMGTSHPKIMRARDSSFPANGHARIDELIQGAIKNRSEATLRAMIAAMVPDFHGGE